MITFGIRHQNAIDPEIFAICVLYCANSAIFVKKHTNLKKKKKTKNKKIPKIKRTL